MSRLESYSAVTTTQRDLVLSAFSVCETTTVDRVITLPTIIRCSNLIAQSVTCLTLPEGSSFTCRTLYAVQLTGYQCLLYFTTNLCRRCLNGLWIATAGGGRSPGVLSSPVELCNATSLVLESLQNEAEWLAWRELCSSGIGTCCVVYIPIPIGVLKSCREVNRRLLNLLVKDFDK